MKRIQIYQDLLVPTQRYTNATTVLLNRPVLHPASSDHSHQEHLQLPLEIHSSALSI